MTPLGTDSLASDLARRVRSLPRLADRLAAMEAVGAGLDRLATLMDRMLASIDTLDANVEALRGRSNRSAAWQTGSPATASPPT